jgi:hypothetical protein
MGKIRMGYGGSIVQQWNDYTGDGGTTAGIMENVEEAPL